MRPGSSVNLAQSEDIDVLIALFEGFVGFAQIVVAMAFNFSLVFPSLFSRLLSAFSVLTFDVLPSLGLNCFLSYNFDYVNKMGTVTVAPLIAITVLVLVSLAMRRVGRIQDSQV